jgi:tetratricopeptide (TPR) repeat protein
MLKVFGDVLQFQNLRDQALQKYDLALSLYQSVGDRLGEAKALIAIGITLGQQEDYRSGVLRIEESLEIYRAIGDRWSEAQTLQVLAISYRGLERSEDAAAAEQRAAAILQEIDQLSAISL